LNRRRFLQIASAAGVVARAQGVAQLKAGTERVDITPPLGIQMAGYNSTGRPATGVLDPLYAQALVLDDGRRKIALVTLDLIFTLLDPEMEEIRALVRKSTGIGRDRCRHRPRISEARQRTVRIGLGTNSDRGQS